MFPKMVRLCCCFGDHLKGVDLGGAKWVASPMGLMNNVWSSAGA